MSVGGASLGSAEGSISIQVAEAIQNVNQLSNSLNTFGAKAGKSFGQFRDAGLLIGGVGTAILGALGLATNTAAAFEQQMSAVKAVTSATGVEFESLRQLALQLGKDTVFSAGEAAQAIEELGKAGVSTRDILSGAAKGAVSLASAAGTGVPEAAIVIANALNIFQLAGDQAPHVADVMAAAANKSATSIEQLAQGMQQIGVVAASFNISLEQTAGQLAAFADNGLKGSDAGTSFKTMLIQMLSPTRTQADLMTALGISFFDAQGQFIGLAGVAQVLQTQLHGLTQEQRLTALAVLFGTDGVRAANILYKEGAAGVDNYTAAVNDSGAASRAAATRLDNLKGSFEQLRGSVQTLAIIVGSIFLPPLRALIDVATSVVNALIGLPGPLQTVAAIMAAAAGAALALGGGFLVLAPRILSTIAALHALLPILAGIAPEVLIIVGALALLGTAYATNFGGFADAVNGAASGIAAGAGKIIAAISPIANVISTLFSSPIAGASGTQITQEFASIGGATTELTKIFGLNLSESASVSRSFQAMQKPLRQVRNSFRDVTKGGSEFFDVITGSANKHELNDFHKRLDRLFGKDLGRKAALATRDLQRGLKDLGTAFGDAFGFDASKLFSLPGILDIASQAVQGFAGFLRRDLIPALGSAFVVAARVASAVLGFLASNMDTLAAVVGFLAGSLRDNLVSAFNILSDLLHGDFSGAFSGLLDLFGQIGGQLWTALTASLAFAVGQGIDLGNILVNAALSFPDAILEGAKDLYGWFLNKLLGPEQGAVVATHPGPLRGAHAREPISFGDVVVTAGLKLIGEAEKWAGNLYGWFIAQISGTSDVAAAPGLGVQGGRISQANPPIDLGAIAVNVGKWFIQTVPDLGLDLIRFLANTVVSLASAVVRIGHWALGTLPDLALDLVRSLAGTVAPLTSVVVRIGGWIIDSAADIGLDIVRFLAATAVTLASVVVRIGGWLVDSVADIGVDVIRFLSATAVTLSSVVVRIGGWVIGSAADIGLDIVRFLAATAVNLASVVISIGGWVIGSATDIGLDIVRFLAATAVTLTSVVVSISSWIVDSATSLGPSVETFLAGAVTTIKNLAIAATEVTITGPVTIHDVSGDDAAPGKSLVDRIIGGITSAADAIHRAGLWVVENFFAGIGFGIGFLAGGAVIAGVGLVKAIIAAVENPGLILDAGVWVSQHLADAVIFPLDMVIDIGKRFWGAVGDGFNAAFDAAGIDIGAMIGDLLHGSTKTDLSGMVPNQKKTEGILSGLRDALTFDVSDIPLPKFPDWITSPASAFKPISDLTTFIGAIVKGENPLETLKNFLVQGASASDGGSFSFSALDEIGTSFKNLSHDLLTAQSDLSNAVEAIKATFQTLFDSTKSPAGNDIGGSVVETVRKQFESLGAAIVEGIGTGFDTALTGAGNPTVKIDDLATGLFNEWQSVAIADAGQNGEDYMAALALGIDTGAPAALIAGQNVVIGLTNVFTTQLDQFITIGQNISVNVAFGVSDAAGAIEGAAAGAVAGAVGAANSATGDFVFVGQNIGAGIIAGINSTVGAIAAAAAAAVAAAVGAAQAQGQIKSPSRVMARLVGEPLAQGIALGIEQGQRNVQRTMAGLIASLSPLSTSPNAAFTAQLRSMPARTSGNSGAVINNTNWIALTEGDLRRLATEAEKGGAAHTWIVDRHRAGTTS